MKACSCKAIPGCQGWPYVSVITPYFLPFNFQFSPEWEMITLFTSGFKYDCILEAPKRRACLPLTAFLHVRSFSHCLFNLSINYMKMVTVSLKNYNFFSVILTVSRRASYTVFSHFKAGKDTNYWYWRVEYWGEQLTTTEEMRRWRELRNEGIHNLHPSSYIGVIKLQDMRWVRHAAPME